MSCFYDSLNNIATNRSTISIERHRGILDRNQRLCPYCIQNNIAVIEDEYHSI